MYGERDRRAHDEKANNAYTRFNRLLLKANNKSSKKKKIIILNRRNEFENDDAFYGPRRCFTNRAYRGFFRRPPVFYILFSLLLDDDTRKYHRYTILLYIYSHSSFLSGNRKLSAVEFSR